MLIIIILENNLPFKSLCVLLTFSLSKSHITTKKVNICYHKTKEYNIYGSAFGVVFFFMPNFFSRFLRIVSASSSPFVWLLVAIGTVSTVTDWAGAE